MGVSYLKLVRDRSGAPNFAQPKFEQIQESLIPARDRTIAICTADGMSEAVIRSLVDTLRPRIILDFRTAPRFDFGALNRGKALDLFASVNAQYHDVGYTIPQCGADPDVLANAICERAVVLEREEPTSAALVFLDAGTNFERTGLSAINKLRGSTKVVWEMLLFGPTTSDDSERRIIFISHANPEDNELALWLQAQLTRLGYETWADVTHLKVGEVFWDSIEDTIRSRAARVIALISRQSLQKPGVLDEISLAISIERARKLNGFVIPVRVDDVPYSDFRANVARKNTVDFSTSWASGLTVLSATLARDRVPRQRQTDGLSLAMWWEETRPPTLSVVDESERLTSNRFEVIVSPSRVYVFSGTPESKLGTALPLTPYKGRFLSFSSDRELVRQGIGGLTRESIVSADDLFAGNLSLTSHISSAARSRLRHGMLNRQWLTFLISKGLRFYTQAGLQPTPYVPDGAVTNNTATFIDSEGKKRKRLLVGYSEKRKLYWHLAPVGAFSTSSTTTLSLRLRVLFSVDGQSDWPSVERMRVTRRAFCKNWWNDRWLSLQNACMSWLSAGEAQLSLYSGDGGTLTLGSAPLSYLSPRSVRETDAKSETESELEKELATSEEDEWVDNELDEDEELNGGALS